jgi:cell shape-determining protein MreD
VKTFRQLVVVLFANGILLFLALEANSALAPLSVYLTVGGMFVVFPALKLPVRAGFPAVLLSGALWDAASPGPFGLFLFATGGLYAGLHRLRHRFRTQRPFPLAVVAAAANLALLLLLGAWFFPAEAHAAYAGRFLLEAVLSEAIVLGLAFWFFPLQEESLGLLGAKPGPDETP